MPKKSKEIQKKTKESNNIILTPNKTWYVKQYKERYLNFPTIPKIKEQFNESKNDYLYLYGTYNRLEALVTFGYFLDIDIVNTICTVFKVKDLTDDIDAIYSFGYFEYEKASKKNKTDKKYKKLGIQPHGTNYKYRYFTTGGSFLSKDGEYRVGLIDYHSIKTINNTPILQNIFQDIKDYLRKHLPKRGIAMLKEYFYPTDEKKSIEIELEYYSFELQNELFAITWFNAIFNLHLNIIENHLNEKFKRIMFKHKTEDLEFFKILIKKYSIEQMNIMRYITNHVFTTGNILKDRRDTATKIGQKIIPLSIYETQHPFNIRFKPWREYLISSHLSNYVVNNISAGFFITNSWFYIKNSRKGLFDNEIQYEKMQRSELAIQITELLNRAQLYTHENIAKKIKKISSKTLDSFISNKFKELSKKIQTPIDYAKEDIIMSNVALCILSEYVGRTIWDVVLLSKSSAYYDKLIGHPFTLNGYPLFAKYMFELCYNLYCMNSISGLIHGDLHLNNATLNSLSYTNVRSIDEITNPKVLYVLGDEKNQYIFPTVGYYLCLIDFSRSIVLPEKIPVLHDPSLPKTYEILDNIKEFQNEQVERLLSLYIHYTSDSSSYKDELRILFKNKFEAVFKLLSTIDLYGVTHKLLHMFKLNDSTVVKPHKNCIDLLQKINNFSQQYFTKEMNKLISNKEYEKTVLEMEWPIYTIIKNCFYEFLTINSTIGNIIDIYNTGNKITYSLNKLELFPPILKDPKYIENNKEKTPDYPKRFKLRRTLFEKEKDTGMKMISFIANRQKQKHL